MKDPYLTKPTNAPILDLKDLGKNPYWQMFTTEVPKSTFSEKTVFHTSDVNPESTFELKELLKRIMKADPFN